jgi:hypothetical protein
VSSAAVPPACVISCRNSHYSDISSRRHSQQSNPKAPSSEDNSKRFPTITQFRRNDFNSNSRLNRPSGKNCDSILYADTILGLAHPLDASHSTRRIISLRHCTSSAHYHRRQTLPPNLSRHHTMVFFPLLHQAHALHFFQRPRYNQRRRRLL